MLMNSAKIALSSSLAFSSVALAQQTVLKSETPASKSVSLKCEINFSSDNRIVFTHSEEFELAAQGTPISQIEMTSNGVGATAFIVHADATTSFAAVEHIPQARPVASGASLVKGGIFLTTLRLLGDRTIDGKQIQEAVFGCKVADLK
ncbi:MAG: hypothetical protein IOD12_14545 [Silvanigrellales bacterium]|jgi:hypothetical protein|nr:hypothetical protein [Silvanigrellales bacterium]